MTNTGRIIKNNNLKTRKFIKNTIFQTKQNKNKNSNIKWKSHNIVQVILSNIISQQTCPHIFRECEFFLYFSFWKLCNRGSTVYDSQVKLRMWVRPRGLFSYPLRLFTGTFLPLTLSTFPLGRTRFFYISLKLEHFCVSSDTLSACMWSVDGGFFTSY